MRFIRDFARGATHIAFALLFIVSAAFAGHLETDDYAEVYRQVVAKEAQFGTEHVLIVFDVDNTLLANRQDLGTDQWFEWQRSLIDSRQYEEAAARDFQGLIDAQTMLYSIGKMRKTEASVSGYVSQIQEKGLKTIVLTARDSSNRDSTLRELSANGLAFKHSGIGQEAGFASRYLPYDSKNPGASGISVRDMMRWNLRTPRSVSYSEGVYMVSGQHKGAMLRVLLSKIGTSFRAIVFVDDKEKNTSDMTAGFEDTTVDLTTIRYTREDANVARFIAGSKDEVTAQWRILSTALSRVFAN